MSDSFVFIKKMRFGVANPSQKKQTNPAKISKMINLTEILTMMNLVESKDQKLILKYPKRHSFTFEKITVVVTNFCLLFWERNSPITVKYNIF